MNSYNNNKWLTFCYRSMMKWFEGKRNETKNHFELKLFVFSLCCSSLSLALWFAVVFYASNFEAYHANNVQNHIIRIAYSSNVSKSVYIIFVISYGTRSFKRLLLKWLHLKHFLWIIYIRFTVLESNNKIFTINRTSAYIALTCSDTCRLGEQGKEAGSRIEQQSNGGC